MSDSHPFYCQHCGRFGLRAITADGVVVRDNKVLLLKRAIEPQKGTWTLPGGFVQLTERVEETVVREVAEETGLKTKITKLIGVFSNPLRDKRHVVTVAYLLKIIGGAQKVNEESSQIRWFDLDDLPEMGFDHKQIVIEAKNSYEPKPQTFL